MGRTISFVTQYEVDFFHKVEEKVNTKFELYPTESEEKVMKNMNKLDKTKRKVKIEFLAKGKSDRFKEIKKKKKQFQ